MTALLGLATLWLGCGTLARDVEECQIQVVAVKPISRWQIWLGKWLGIMSLNAVLLGLAGLSIFLLLQWRASRLP
jgi:ABC-type transport system involved in multi-copper enzyme maturation permease subunit